MLAKTLLRCWVRIKKASDKNDVPGTRKGKPGTSHVTPLCCNQW